MDARVLRQQSCRRQRLHEPWFILLFAPNGPKVRPQLAPCNLGSASDINEASCIVHRWELIRREKTQESPGSGRVYISHIALQKISQDTDEILGDSASPEANVRDLPISPISAYLSKCYHRRPPIASILYGSEPAEKRSLKSKERPRYAQSKVHSNNRRGKQSNSGQTEYEFEEEGKKKHVLLAPTSCFNFNNCANQQTLAAAQAASETKQKHENQGLSGWC
ncbi:hypothetical protein BJX62DRAFT_137388 [Aspergillus germanicus]